MLAGLSVLALSATTALPAVADTQPVAKVSPETANKQVGTQADRDRQQLIEDIDQMFEKERQAMMAELNQRLDQMHQEMVRMVDERFRQLQEQRLNR
jgi:TolA-binding protein